MNIMSTLGEEKNVGDNFDEEEEAGEAWIEEGHEVRK